MIRTAIYAIGSAIQNNPGATAGLCGFLVAFWLVAGNALYSQPGSHPGPLWATRDSVVTRAISKNPERAPRQSVSERRLELPDKVPVPSARARARASSAPDGANLVRSIQSALAEAGYYRETVDGRYGPKTRAAIVRFQAASGIRADGEVTIGLLAALQARNEVKPSHRRERDLTERIEEVVAVSRGDDADERFDEVASAPPAADSLAAASITLADVTRAATIARIQIGLINFGEAGVVVDGTLGEDTVAAIREFQRRYGLPVTGEPDDAVVRKLESLGVLQQI